MAEPLSAPKAPASNSPELTVSELSGALKRAIEDRFGYVRVRGEISNYRGPHSSGHCYFSLKDESARIDAVIWKGNFNRLRVRPEEGMEVIATGKVTTFPGKSAYQIVIEALEPAGVGALMALVEERRRRLAAEGLFDAARKQLLPYLPEVIGVVTSPTGAVIRDILHRLAERFPRHVLVWPVRVQGETSAAEVTAAIEGFNAIEEGGRIPRPSIIIVARGGGSLEDLWSFNDEGVVRAAAASLIPLVSAVGHETDWTLIDHAADRRAPTPTGAAEICVPVRSDLLASLFGLESRRQGGSLRYLERLRAGLRAMIRALPSGEAVIALPAQRLDRSATRLVPALRAGHDRHALILSRLGHRLSGQSPHARLARASARLEALDSRAARALEVAGERRLQRFRTAGQRLEAAFAARLNLGRQRHLADRQRLQLLHDRMGRALDGAGRRRLASITALAQLLRSLGYRNVLARGFALVRDAEGKPLRLAAAVANGEKLDIEWADGHVRAIAETSAPAAPKAARRPAKPKLQGSLF